MSSKKEYKDVDNFFKAQLTPNQKAWSIIHEFYHIILTYMEKKKITKADLARKLGKSRASVSKMFNKTPNLTVKKMVEIADAIGVELNIDIHDLEKYKRKKFIKNIHIYLRPESNWQGIHTTSQYSIWNDKYREISTDSSFSDDHKDMLC